MYKSYVNYFLSISMLFFAKAAFGITINEVDINKIASRGKVITYTNSDSKADNVSVHLDKKNLQVGTISLTDSHQINDFLQKLQNEKLRTMSAGNKITLQAGGNNTHRGSHLTAKEEIILKAGMLASIKNSILESPQVHIVAKKFDFEGCFLKNTEHLWLESASDKSLFKVMRFKFPKNPMLPPMIQGSIDFETGFMSDKMIVTGAAEVDILCGDTAFQQ